MLLVRNFSECDQWNSILDQKYEEWTVVELFCRVNVSVTDGQAISMSWVVQDTDTVQFDAVIGSDYIGTDKFYKPLSLHDILCQMSQMYHFSSCSTLFICRYCIFRDKSNSISTSLKIDCYLRFQLNYIETLHKQYYSIIEYWR